MPRRPDNAIARPVHIGVRLSTEELAELDAKRADRTRSGFIRTLIHSAETRKDPS